MLLVCLSAGVGCIVSSPCDFTIPYDCMCDAETHIHPSDKGRMVKHLSSHSTFLTPENSLDYGQYEYVQLLACLSFTVWLMTTLSANPQPPSSIHM
jgi:hypothetical protein